MCILEKFRTLNIRTDRQLCMFVIPKFIHFVRNLVNNYHHGPNKTSTFLDLGSCDNVVKCDTVWSGRSSLTFRRNTLPPSSGSERQAGRKQTLLYRISDCVAVRTEIYVFCNIKPCQHHHDHHHHWQKRSFLTIAYLRRFCQIASGFHFFGYHNHNFFTRQSHQPCT
jgi:hypothetical protein